LFVAGVIDPAHAADVAAELDKLAAEAQPTKPAYGAPSALAVLVRARAQFFGGACVIDPARADVATPVGAADDKTYDVPLDFYAAYHVPFFATWAVCERAALLAIRGNRAGAAALLKPIATRAPNRHWLLATLKRYE
jgi:hypothetical protein